MQFNRLWMYSRKEMEVCHGFISVLLGFTVGWNALWICLVEYPFSLKFYGMSPLFRGQFCQKYPLSYVQEWRGH